MNFNFYSIFFLLVQICRSAINLQCGQAILQFPEYKCVNQKSFGEGATGIAFLVQKANSNNDQFILKVQLVKNPDKRQRAFMEYNLLKRIDHPNIIKVYESSYIGDYFYELMEFGTFGSLESVIKNFPGKYDNRKNVFNFLEMTLSAMNYLHNEARVVHADLKIENIVLGNDFIPKIIDFDLSVAFGTKDRLRGTDPYKEPTLLFSQKGEYLYDEYVDIYALGIILYTMTHRGVHPFNIRNDDLLYQSLKTGIYKIRKGVDLEIAYLINRCLKWDKTKRMSVSQLILFTQIAFQNSSPSSLNQELTFSNKIDLQNSIFASIEIQHGLILEKEAQKKTISIDFNNNFEPLKKPPSYKIEKKEGTGYQQNGKENSENRNILPNKNHQTSNARFLNIVCALMAIILLVYLTILVFCKYRSSYFSSTSSNNQSSTHTSRVVNRSNNIQTNSSNIAKTVVVREPIIVTDSRAERNNVANTSRIVTTHVISSSGSNVPKKNYYSSSKTTTYKTER